MTLLRAIGRRRGYFYLAGALLAVDQITKVMAHALLRGRGIGACENVPARGLPPESSGCIEVIPEFFNLWYSRNPGGLFGYFRDWADPWRTLFLTLVPVFAVGVITIFLARAEDEDRSSMLGLSLVLGGAVGNLIDRIFRGEVVDFFDAYASYELMPAVAGWLNARFHTVHWPTFNLADSGIVIGVFLLLLDVVRPSRAGKKEPSPPAPASG